METCSLEIVIDASDQALRPGGRVAGRVEVSREALSEKGFQVEVWLLLIVEVGENLATIPLGWEIVEASRSVDEAEGNVDFPFSVQIPKDRRTYEGRAFALGLAIEARIVVGDAGAGRVLGEVRDVLEVIPDPSERLELQLGGEAQGDYRGARRRLFALTAGPLGLAGLFALGGAVGLGALYVVAGLVGALGVGIGAGAWGRYNEVRDAPKLFAVTLEQRHEGGYRASPRGEALHCQVVYAAGIALQSVSATLEVRERVLLEPPPDFALFGGRDGHRGKTSVEAIFARETVLIAIDSGGGYEGRVVVPDDVSLPPTLSVRHERGRFEAGIDWVLILTAHPKEGGPWRHEIPLVALSPDASPAVPPGRG
ncbi:MAG: hypothetical protein KAI47_02440 [Deltaproteobacteria bacterium]|nr:hypothetical protein [Deltaproteobacteria bacterium]